MTKHLFVAPSTQSFGELVLGLRLAEALRARGDDVHFLAPRANELLLRDAGFPHTAIDPVLPVIDRALHDAIAEHRADTVVLVDLLVTVFTYISRGVDPQRLDHLPVPVYAMDIWDLRRSTLRVDLNAGAVFLPESVRHIVPRRLVPVPFINLDAKGAYNALPAPPERDVRDEARTELGLAAGERLVLFTTSGFQSAATYPAQRKLIAAVPRHIIQLCQRTDDRVRVLHIGPEEVAGAGEGYRFHPQVAGTAYRRLLQAADLMVNMNQSATSISTALATELPTLVATSAAAAGEANVSPFAFRVFPFGMVKFMTRILEDNPYAGAVRSAEIAPGDAFVAAARELLFDDGVREATLARMRGYVAAVRALPPCTAVLDTLR